jgi:uncharacterized surface protein with fasciclin (FAS1) repeats
MKSNKYSIAKLGIALTIAASVFTSCNKELPNPTPIVTPVPGGSTFADVLNLDPNYSFLKAAVSRVPGLLATLGDRNTVFTLYAPDNAAFIASGIPSEAVIGALPLTTIVPLLQYHLVGGQKLTSAVTPATFPNAQEPTNLVLSAPFFRMSAFPSKRGTSMWVNNIPVVGPDVAVANGIVHKMAAVLAPPSQLLAQILYADPNLSYFAAAVAKADEGQTGTNRIDSLLKFAPVNMTILAPNNTAFRNMLDTTIRRALLQQGMPAAVAAATATSLASTPAVFNNPALAAVLTPATVRGILAYHVLASKNTNPAAFQPDIRAFSNNFSTTPSFHTTLVNGSVAVHPGVLAQATFTGPFVTSLKFTGLGTLPSGGAPFSGVAANAITQDVHAVNGVVHVIDRVLLPQ